MTPEKKKPTRAAIAQKIRGFRALIALSIRLLNI